MKRTVIHIDEEKCTGCGLCLPNCPEGAIQIIDGKARLVSDLLCDGLGACLGHCPEGAITTEVREAEPYNEITVMANVVKQGPNVIKAHLKHLKDHDQEEFLQQALDYLKKEGISIDWPEKIAPAPPIVHSGCPGSKMMSFSAKKESKDESGKRPSQLRQWPVQLHLISPHASYFKNSDLLMAADCVAYALADFHKDYLKNKSLIIACPKLDSSREIYIDKIAALVEQANINSLTVMIMQVPCCMGFLQIAKQAVEKASRNIPIKIIVVDIQGEILKNEWI